MLKTLGLGAAAAVSLPGWLAAEGKSVPRPNVLFIAAGKEHKATVEKLSKLLSAGWRGALPPTS